RRQLESQRGWRELFEDAFLRVGRAPLRGVRDRKHPKFRRLAGTLAPPLPSKVLAQKKWSFHYSPAAGIAWLRKEHGRIFLIIQLRRNLAISEFLNLQGFEPFVRHAFQVGKAAFGEIFDIGRWGEHSGFLHFCRG